MPSAPAEKRKRETTKDSHGIGKLGIIIINISNCNTGSTRSLPGFFSFSPYYSVFLPGSLSCFETCMLRPVASLSSCSWKYNISHPSTGLMIGAAVGFLATDLPSYLRPSQLVLTCGFKQALWLVVSSALCYVVDI
jgi:hypothetical protein